MRENQQENSTGIAASDEVLGADGRFYTVITGVDAGDKGSDSTSDFDIKKSTLAALLSTHANDEIFYVTTGIGGNTGKPTLDNTVFTDVKAQTGIDHINVLFFDSGEQNLVEAGTLVTGLSIAAIIGVMAMDKGRKVEYFDRRDVLKAFGAFAAVLTPFGAGLLGSIVTGNSGSSFDNHLLATTIENSKQELTKKAVILIDKDITTISIQDIVHALQNPEAINGIGFGANMSAEPVIY